MKRRPRFTPKIDAAMQTAVAGLRKAEYATVEELAAQAGVAIPTMKRALQLLEKDYPSAGLEYCHRLRARRMRNKKFELPLAQPTINHLLALTTARDLLKQLALSDIADSVSTLLDQLSAKYLKQKGAAAFHPDALRVLQHSTLVPETRLLLKILPQVRRGVIRLRYYSPWEDRTGSYVVEPWQLALVNGVLYLKGWARDRRAPREFRMATIQGASIVDGSRPVAAVPEGLWPDDLAFGIDEDRPGDADLTFAGPVARYLRPSRWHSRQVDEWFQRGDRLRRQMPFSSCRELARFLAQYADGLVSVQPTNLRLELQDLLRKGVANMRDRRAGDSR